MDNVDMEFKGDPKRKKLYQSLFQPPKPVIVKKKVPEIMQNIEIENVEPSTMATLLERTEMSIPENKISNEKKPEKKITKTYNLALSNMEEYEYTSPILLEGMVFWAMIRRDNKKLFKFIAESDIPKCDKLFLKDSQ